jgi:hypothetical protein
MTEIYYNNYQGCYELLVSSLLKNAGLNEKLFWYQSRIYYNIDERVLYSSDYGNNIFELLWNEYDGVKLSFKNFSHVDKLVNDLIKQLSAGSIGLFVDLFELPYCVYYGVFHETHTIEIVSFDKNLDSFLIVDHYYKFKGYVSLNIIRKCLQSYMSQLKKEISYFFVEVTNSNLDRYLNVDDRLICNYISDEQFSSSFQGIFEDLALLKNVFGQDKFISQIERISTYLKRFSGSQKMVSVYIGEILNVTNRSFVDIENLEFLKNEYKKSSEIINLIANILMKEMTKQELGRDLDRHYSVKVFDLLIESYNINKTINHTLKNLGRNF